MPKSATCAAICLLAVLAVLAVGGAGSQNADNGKNGENSPTTQPAASQPARPQNNLEYWLSQAVPAATQPDTQTRADDQGTNPLARRDRPFRRAALSGVVELSDGRQLAGALYTTREKPWLVFVEKEKRWRRIPFVTALSITAVVVSEEMALQWRWKAMGEPERVYTGKKFPTSGGSSSQPPCATPSWPTRPRRPQPHSGEPQGALKIPPSASPCYF